MTDKITKRVRGSVEDLGEGVDKAFGIKEKKHYRRKKSKKGKYTMT